MRKLHNPVESLDNVTLAPNYREHGTRIGNLVAPNASWRSLASVRKAVQRTVVIPFAPIERDGPLTKHDAIENAIGSVDYGEDHTLWDVLESEGWSIEFSAERLS